MLPFHEQIVGELVEEDGIVVMGAGLGLPKVLASVLLLHSGTNGLVLILSATDSQRQYVREELQAMDPNSIPVVEINNEFTSAERTTFYLKGGAYIITSRILIVDMLSERVPLQNIAGILVTNAHRITETCAEAFILRLYRQANKKGWVRAFTDRPQAMVSGFSKTERIMKSLFVKRLHLWPRFQLSVSTILEENPPDVIDIRMPLTPTMEGIQMAILEVMDACLKELRKTNKVDVEELTVENGLFKSFDEIIRRQLDPIWHQVGRKTKQLVGDLNTLRKLAEYLLRYDAVTFLKYLDTLRMSESAWSVWIYATPTHRIFDLAKKRVYRIMRIDANGNPIVVPTAKPSRGFSKRKFVPESKRVVGFGVLNGVYDEGQKRMKTEVVDLTEDELLKETKANAETGNEQETGASASGVGGETQGVELEVVVEEMPKWRVLREVLEEIEEEREKAASTSAPKESSSQDAWGDGCGAVLVACKDERTCVQLQGVITKGPERLLREEWNNYLLGKAELQRIRLRGKKRVKRGVKGVGVYNGVVQNNAEARDTSSNAQKEEQDALLAAAAQLAAHEREVIGAGEQVFSSKGVGAQGRTKGRGRGRGRGRGKGKLNQARNGLEQKRKGKGGVQISGEDQAEVIEGQFQGMKILEGAQSEQNSRCGNVESLQDGDTNAKIVEDIREGQGPVMKPVPLVHYYALESEQRILDVVKPQYVIVYDPDMGFVRQLEVFKAQCPLQKLKVYFLIHEDSTEAQKFEASIRRENTSFESLIRQKASMMIPVDQDGRMLDVTTSTQSATGVTLNTRKAGGRKVAEKQMQVIVDMREFNSSLPSVLHQQGMRIIPVTLEVGDYILSPDICVERKSISDLYSSFASGRLYHQAETMTRYYKLPVLLIEFSQDKSFSLQSASDVGEDIIQANIISKLSLLVLHFPRLRIVWSRSLHATADVFASLKANQDEPDVDRAMRIGVPTEDGLIEGDMRAENHNTTAIELLRRLPGVTDANYRTIMDGCESLADLSLMPVEKLATIMGGQRPARMLRDFLDAKCPVL